MRRLPEKDFSNLRSLKYSKISVPQDSRVAPRCWSKVLDQEDSGRSRRHSVPHRNGFRAWCARLLQKQAELYVGFVFSNVTGNTHEGHISVSL